MFRIFDQFNPLFYNINIKAAILDNQKELLDKVKVKINLLRDKFLKGYDQSDVGRLSKIRDIQQISGKMIWGRQIQKKLNRFMSQIVTVLGKDWDEQDQGRELKELGKKFEKKLANHNRSCEYKLKEMSNIKDSI